jgi:hypothetical protein
MNAQMSVSPVVCQSSRLSCSTIVGLPVALNSTSATGSVLFTIVAGTFSLFFVHFEREPFSPLVLSLQMPVVDAKTFVLPPQQHNRQVSIEQAIARC